MALRASRAARTENMSKLKALGSNVACPPSAMLWRMGRRFGAWPALSASEEASSPRRFASRSRPVLRPPQGAADQGGLPKPQLVVAPVRPYANLGTIIAPLFALFLEPTLANQPPTKIIAPSSVNQQSHACSCSQSAQHALERYELMNSSLIPFFPWPFPPFR